MAHKKAAGAARQQGNRQGKHRGLKKHDGQSVKAGSILLRQIGTVYKPGDNTKLAKDFTIFAIKDGTVRYKNASKYKKVVYVE